MSQNSNNLAAFIWSLADLLRGNFKQSQYGRVILPFTLLRRMECVLEPTKSAVLAEFEKVKKMKVSEPIGFSEGKLQLEMDPSIRPTVVFTFPEDSQFPGQVVVTVLRDLHRMVTSIVDDFIAIS